MNVLAQLQKTQSLHYNGQIKLNSPTSVTMQNSFLIKNHNASNFDVYYQQMKKRKMNLSGGMSPDKLSPMMRLGGDQSNALCHMKGRRPAARDGHSGIAFENHMVVFGGDRHHMPFNDCYVLDLKSEMQTLGLL